MPPKTVKDKGAGKKSVRRSPRFADGNLSDLDSVLGLVSIPNTEDREERSCSEDSDETDSQARGRPRNRPHRATGSSRNAERDFESSWARNKKTASKSKGAGARSLAAALSARLAESGKDTDELDRIIRESVRDLSLIHI